MIGITKNNLTICLLDIYNIISKTINTFSYKKNENVKHVFSVNAKTLIDKIECGS